MDKAKKVIGVNLLIMLAWLAGIGFAHNGSLIGIGLFALIFVVTQIIVNLLIGIVFYLKKDVPGGNTFMVSAGVVMIVGGIAYYAMLTLFT